MALVKIKLGRKGNTHRPTYEFLVADSRKPRDTGLRIGYYNPFTKEVKVDTVAFAEWISKGAQPTKKVIRLVSKVDSSVIPAKMMAKFNYQISLKGKPAKKEEKAA